MAGGRYFLGMHVGHDRGITVADEHQILFHTAVERLDRKKYSDSWRLPEAQLQLVFDYLGIAIDDIAAAAVSYHAIEAPRIAPTLEANFRRAFPGFDGRFAAVDHHLCHALGAKVCSGFEDAVVVIADGAGDQRRWGTQAESVFRVTDDTFYLLEERVQAAPTATVNRPEFFDPNFFRPEDEQRQISLGLKYEQITYLCGFGPGQAGQTMALAAFGEPLFDYAHLVPKDLSFSLRYPDFLREFARIAATQGQTLQEFARERRADIAATYQRFLEEALSAIAATVIASHEPRNICFAGGLFMNCLANRRISDEHPDRRLFFFPPSTDEGQSIGTAAYAAWEAGGRLPRNAPDLPYLGREFSDSACRTVLEEAGLGFDRFDEAEMARQLAGWLAAGKIVGLLRGRSETGPRALGHRSILADPRERRSKERLDAGIKRRAEFRPYAPMILARSAGEFTDLVTPAPHMLLTAKVRERWRSVLPAIVHVDGSTRPQTVEPEDEPFLFRLLSEFEALTGVPALLNTSFNDEKSPMVDSPADALRVFQSTDLDVLILGDYAHIRRE
jgi:carbamoyltransferase